MHEVLVNRLGGLSLPRKSVVRLTDRPDMTLDVYHGCKTTIQQQFSSVLKNVIFCVFQKCYSDFELQGVLENILNSKTYQTICSRLQV